MTTMIESRAASTEAKMIRKVYLAGPMRGYPEFNFPAFGKAAEVLRHRGFVVISPAEHDIENGLDVTGLTGNETDLPNFNLDEALAWDLEQIPKVDAVVVLPGWRRSKGTADEVARADSLGKPVLDYGLLTAAGAQKAPLAMWWAVYYIAGSNPAVAVPAPNTNTTEVRTTSTTGGEKGVKLARFDLIPVGPLTKLAEVYGYGATKYADRNWERGYEWSKSYGALMRHITQWFAGEDNDPESGLHLASVAWHAMALMEWANTHPEFDDRPKHG